MIDFEKVVIAVTTWNFPVGLQNTLAGAVRSVPSYRALYVFGNHPTDNEQVPLLLPNIPGSYVQRNHYVPTDRIPWHEGNLAKTWNTAMMWAFQDPDVEWLWCMHDDLTIEPGWPGVLAAQPPREVYCAPFGDMCFLFSRRAFREVGWFDERFVIRAYHDNDWILRAVWKLGLAAISMDNAIDGLTWRSHNSVGLLNYWKTARHFDNNRSNKVALEYFKQKWGTSWLTTQNQLDWDAATKRGPAIPDIDFYPWFKR